MSHSEGSVFRPLVGPYSFSITGEATVPRFRKTMKLKSSFKLPAMVLGLSVVLLSAILVTANEGM